MTTSAFQNRANRTFSLSLMFVLAAAGAAAAQSEPYESLNSRGPYYQPVRPYPVEMGFTQHHSSTAIEGAQRGRAAVIQAWANAQLSLSQAAVINEQARALDRENCLKQTQALQAQKEMWNSARIEAREQRVARIAEGLKKIEEQQATTYRQAYELSSSEFDPKTGAIKWPRALQSAKYQPVRERIEELFREQLGYGDPQPGAVKEIAQNVETLRRALRSDISSMPQQDFLAASKFLVGLKVTAASMASAA